MTGMQRAGVFKRISLYACLINTALCVFNAQYMEGLGWGCASLFAWEILGLYKELDTRYSVPPVSKEPK